MKGKKTKPLPYRCQNVVTILSDGMKSQSRSIVEGLTAKKTIFTGDQELRCAAVSNESILEGAMGESHPNQINLVADISFH